MHSTTRLVLGAAALAACLIGAQACSGAGSGGECRDSGDCIGDEECLGPNAPQVCGIPPEEGCGTDADCAGEVCHAISDPCSPDGVGSRCGPSCSDGGCVEGFRCGAGGACEAEPCDEGYECPAHQQCDADALAGVETVHARHHGCVHVSCSSDADCPADQACVNARCQTGPGTCQVPMAVP